MVKVLISVAGHAFGSWDVLLLSHLCCLYAQQATRVDIVLIHKGNPNLGFYRWAVVSH